jgi:hypothetical protein
MVAEYFQLKQGSVFLLLQAMFGCCDLAHTAAQLSVVHATNGPADGTTEPATAAVSAVNALSMQINTNSFKIYLTFVTDVGGVHLLSKLALSSWFCREVLC